MSGFYLKKHTNFIERVAQKSGDLSLLAKGDGTEVLLQEVQADKVICVAPGARPETMEFFYVLDGVLEWIRDDSNILLSSGDYFYTHHLTDTECLKTVTDTKILYTSTQPIFHFLSEKIKELTSVVDKVQSKDQYTHQHSKRVQEYAMRIAERLSFSKERLEALLFASLFHDVGKVDVPESILLKKGFLTAKEWESIRQHPLAGKKILKNTFLEYVGSIIEQHHERMDGSGYPLGLKGSQIKLEARIIGVVDSYDAMTTNRPYRQALTKQEALSELQKHSGSLYDSKVVAIFEEIINEEDG